jgi:hypothetical protein
MYRTVAVLFCCLSLLAATAAPVPPYRPRAWVTGWDRPAGAGLFDRRGDKLIITVPGEC